MKLEITKEDLIKILDSEPLHRMIADIIVEKMTNQQWNEYNKTLLDSFKRADKEIIDDYIQNYYAGDPKNRIINALKDMDKKQIIGMM